MTNPKNSHINESSLIYFDTKRNGFSLMGGGEVYYDKMDHSEFNTMSPLRKMLSLEEYTNNKRRK